MGARPLHTVINLSFGMQLNIYQRLFNFFLRLFIVIGLFGISVRLSLSGEPFGTWHQEVVVEHDLCPVPAFCWAQLVPRNNGLLVKRDTAMLKQLLAAGDDSLPKLFVCILENITQKIHHHNCFCYYSRLLNCAINLDSLEISKEVLCVWHFLTVSQK